MNWKHKRGLKGKKFFSYITMQDLIDKEPKETQLEMCKEDIQDKIENTDEEFLEMYNKLNKEDLKCLRLEKYKESPNCGCEV